MFANLWQAARGNYPSGNSIGRPPHPDLVMLQKCSATEQTRVSSIARPTNEWATALSYTPNRTS